MTCTLMKKRSRVAVAVVGIDNDDQNDSSSSSYSRWNRVPNEIAAQIDRHLEYRLWCSVCSLALVCKGWKTAFRSDALWIRRVCDRYPGAVIRGKDSLSSSWWEYAKKVWSFAHSSFPSSLASWLTPGYPSEAYKQREGQKLAQMVEGAPVFGTLAELQAFGREAGLSEHGRIALWNYCRSLGNSLVYPQCDERGRRVLIMMGLPASGKSTYVSSSVPEPKVCLTIKTPKRPKELEAALAREQPPNTTIVVEAGNSNATRHRFPLIEVSAKYGWPVHIVFIDTPWSVCKDRNSKRSDATKAKPMMFSSFNQYLVRPSLLEGVSTVTTVVGNANNH